MIDVGFLAIASHETVELRRFARNPGLAAKHLDCWEDRELTFLTIGELHHRDDRLRWLRARAPSAAPALSDRSDAALCAALYREGGFDGLRQIEGEFAVVGVDRETRRLMVLRDPVGHYPCFWARSGDRLLVATTVRALVDHMPEPEIDGEYLADFFALSRYSYAELPTERTVYRQVNRLLPGWSLDVTLAAGAVRCREYWDWEARRSAAAGVTSFEEAATLVRKALDSSVAERVRRASRTACHFSGGFDSTGVALVANRLLLAHDDVLDALSLVDASDRVQAGESAYVAAALAGRHGITHHRCAAEDLVEFTGQDRAPLLDEPSPMVADFRRMEVLLEAARSAGADTVLTGDGGDVLFDQPPAFMVAQLLRSGRVGRALELARAKALARSDATGDILRDACRYALPRFRRRRRSDGLPQSLRWLAPDFVERYRMGTRVRDWEATRRERGPFALERLPYLAGDWYHWNLAVPRSMVQSQPFFDPRLMAAVAALPPDIALKSAPAKPLLAAALEDLLPEKIVKRPRKAHFNVVLSGFAVHGEWLSQTIREAPGVDGVIDRAALTDAIELAGMGAFEDAPAANRLSVAVGFLVWSNDRSAWRSQRVPYLERPQHCEVQ